MTLCSSPLRAASNILLASAIASGGSWSAERGPPSVCGDTASMFVKDAGIQYDRSSDAVGVRLLQVVSYHIRPASALVDERFEDRLYNSVNAP